MKVSVKLTAGEGIEVADFIKIDDRKLEELSEDEVEAAIEVFVREWANERIRIEWEVEE